MNKKLDRNYYDVLEIDKNSDDATIKKAYRKAALLHHPDKGGTDDMFQRVNEAFNVLSDTMKRAEYDRDIKKYNLKDGSKKRDSKAGDSQGFSQGARTQQSFKEQEEPKLFQKKSTFVEIPQNLSMLSIKELKLILESLDIKSDDCFEKNDLISRINEYQQKRKQRRDSQKEHPPTNKQTNQNKENKRPSQSQPSSDTTSNDNFTFMPKTETVTFKIISVGNQEVGKSCLIKRYCEEKFVERYISTIGIDYGVKKLKIKGQQIAINFFDMSGNEDYKLIRNEFYSDTCGVIMVFDLDNRDSYNSLIHWEEEMKRNGVDANRVKVVVCGNKSDSKGREINSKEAQKWAKQRNYDYFETSAASGVNVSQAFLTLFEKCLTQYQNDRKHFGI